MHVFSAHRLAGLLLIAVVIAGLGYLRFGVAPVLVGVPAGARAGDLTLSPCTFATESGDAAGDCGTLIVLEDRVNPASRLLALPVIRIKATFSQSAEPIFYLEGGPGLSNMVFPQASRFATDRDVVLVGYRGRDGSVQLDCPEVPSALKRSPDALSEASFRAYGDAFRACADRLSRDGLDLTMYGLPQQVDDLETARVVLGYSRIDLLSQSAGTRTAMIYAWRYPTSINRSVMIGVNPPGNFLFDPRTSDEQMARFAADCAQDAGCRRRTDDLAATMRRLATNMPERWFFLPIKKSNVEVAAFFNLIAPNDLMAATLDSWLSANEGDPSGLWFQSIFGDLFTSPFVWGQYAAGAMVDVQAAHDYFSADVEDRTNFGWLGSAYSWGGGRLVDGWPVPKGAEAYSRVRSSSLETLLISGALDTATPPQIAAKQLLPYLPNGHQVVLPGVGHIASFFETQPDAGARLINTFFETGRVDDSIFQPRTFDFTPSMTLSEVARLLAGTMVGFALLSVLSLVWMARRVHHAGQFGWRTSTFLRSVYALVLGLGGWFLCGLIVTSVLPASHIDDQLLVVASVGMTVGLCIYFAWTHRDSPTTTRTLGFAAAITGALLGAWLGINATEGIPAPMSGLLAPFTAVIAAVAVANLSVLVLDIWWERRTEPANTKARSTRAIATS
jgi:pimeloyl-ACP methyl ester carboxylesterase